MRDRARLLALGGVVGPAAFVAAWIAAGLSTSGYSAVADAISDLAAVGSPTRVVMTAGFLVFGAGLVAFGCALRTALEGSAWIAAVTTGVATIGVAATPLGGWAGDGVHATCAGIGYVSIAALPLLAAGALRRVGRPDWARVSLVVAVIAAACLAASTLGPNHGLWQRLGLTTGDIWIVVAGVLIASGRMTERVPRRESRSPAHHRR